MNMNFVENGANANKYRGALQQLLDPTLAGDIWLDKDKRPTLGWIVWLLEEVLKSSPQSEARARQAWSAFDELFLGRPDYGLWRRIEAPAFWRRGKNETLSHFRPRSTLFYRPRESADPALGSIPKDDQYLALPKTIRLGLVGAAVDYLWQAQRAAKHDTNRKIAGTEIPAVAPNGELKGTFQEELHELLRTAMAAFRREGFGNPAEAHLFISSIGFLYPKAHLQPVEAHLVPLLRTAFNRLDSHFTCDLPKRGIPIFKLGPLNHLDAAGCRYVPTSNDDQWQMLCNSVHLLGSPLKQLAASQFGSPALQIDTLAFNVAILAARARILRIMRIGRARKAAAACWRSANRTIEYMRYQELAAFRNAAEGAALAGRWMLSAKLWATYLWYHDAISENSQPPSHCYRIVIDAGFRPNGNTRTQKASLPERALSRTEANPYARSRSSYPVSCIAYDATIANCFHQWASLKTALKAAGFAEDYDELPWAMLTDLNTLVKERLDSGQKQPSDEPLVGAGFDVAVAFERIELASDFLRHLGKPDHQRVALFVHKIRDALQWGHRAVDPRKIEKWLSIARDAIARCPDFDALSWRDRFYCHEVMTGRFIKLAASLSEEDRKHFVGAISGDTSDDDLEEVFEADPDAIAIGYGEIRISNLDERLATASRDAGAPMGALSLLICGDKLSYCFKESDYLDPDLAKFATASGCLSSIGLDGQLRSILSMRSGENFRGGIYASIENAVSWPVDLIRLFATIFERWPIRERRLAGYVVLSVNGPFYGLPWQHLVSLALQRGQTGMEHRSPAVSIVPNFALLMAGASKKVETAPKLLCLPSPEENISDPTVKDVMRRLVASLRNFKRTFSLGLAVGHGPGDGNDVAQLTTPTLEMPRITIDTGRTLGAEEFSRIYPMQVAMFGSCGLGAPGVTYFGDIGGVLSPFLAQPGGLLLAPIGDVSPDATVGLAQFVLQSAQPIGVIRAYQNALRRNPECYLYSLYGFPPVFFDGIADKAPIPKPAFGLAKPETVAVARR